MAGLVLDSLSVAAGSAGLTFSWSAASAPQTGINAQGELEFTFTSSDDAAFFRIEAK